MANSEEEVKIVSERQKRKEALDMLKNDSFIDIAAAYIINTDNEYGEKINELIETFVYRPELYTWFGSEIVNDTLLNSRLDKGIYSGSISEKELIESCGKKFEDYLSCLKVKDITKKESLTAHRNKYLFEIKGENPDLFDEIINEYKNNIIIKKIHQASKGIRSSRRSFLERLLDL